MLQLRSCQLALLVSLAFGAILTVFSAPLIAQTTQKSPGIPDLSGYDSKTRRTMELACSVEKANGPVAYGTCLNRQIAFAKIRQRGSLQKWPGIPSLSGYDSEMRELMELACVSHKVLGPAFYSECLNAQIASLQKWPGIPSLSGYDSETRELMELACVSHKVLGPVLYSECLNAQIASLQRSPGVYNSETRHGDGYSKPARDSLKKLIEKPAAR
ncbi:hypothetical protein [Bradyrhizobium sp. 2TAF36]|uniref:hypothetical protein n=1 Tax=Bradyrhizobium sp. 2TAF36 TaxID=3233016 RepID=UPI003F8F6888